jgi:hypothetical protein
MIAVLAGWGQSPIERILKVILIPGFSPEGGIALTRGESPLPRLIIKPELTKMVKLTRDNRFAKMSGLQDQGIFSG